MSIYRNVVWFAKGMREYTKSGFASAAKKFNQSDLEVDCSGLSYMITGANSGIGKVTALEIAKRGGTVHLVCRNKERGEQAMEEIKSACQHENIHLHLLDISKPRDVTQFAHDFAQGGQPLHVLINNAGAMVNTRELTPEGLEKNFATNTVGTYLLTVGLIPLLLKGEKPRVITVTSGGMLVEKLDAKDLNLENRKPFDGTFAYAQNKRQQVVVTEHWAKKYPTLHFSVTHPGWADTPAVRSAMPDFYEKMKNRLRTAEEGADTMIWLAISQAALNTPSGLFFQDRVEAKKHLPLAWTKSTAEDEQILMNKLDELATEFKVVSQL